MMKIAARLCLLLVLGTGTLVAEPAPGSAQRERPGLRAAGFWEPLDEEAVTGEKLVYMLAHQSRAAADALTTKIERVFLAGTDYSPLK